MEQRIAQFSQWIVNCLNQPLQEIKQIPGDASTRRYFRVFIEQKSYILMDAPNQVDSLTDFLLVNQHLQAQQVNVPEVLASNLDDGFLLLSDFGDQTLLKILTIDNADFIYRQAIDSLLKVQLDTAKNAQTLNHFDCNMMQREIELFTGWFLTRQLKLKLTNSESQRLQQDIDCLIQTVNQQPYVYCHRDYHSRNLLLLVNQQIGIIDFQDAVNGPISYDLVSLLRDCYIRWPSKQVQNWVKYYHQHAQRHDLIDCSVEQFLYWFDWTGIQRHIKAIGIFARLDLHFNKHQFLNDIAIPLDYLIDISSNYPKLQTFHHWVKNRIKPKFAEYLATHQDRA